MNTVRVDLQLNWPSFFLVALRGMDGGLSEVILTETADWDLIHMAVTWPDFTTHALKNKISF